MKTPKCPKCGRRLPSPRAECAQCWIDANRKRHLADNYRPRGL